MLTYFTVPKPFAGQIGVTQQNALRSWQSTHPGSQILLFGDVNGADGVCDRLGLTHVRDIETNTYGTPLLDSVFQRAQDLARFPVVCYVNADIILPPNFGVLPSSTLSAPLLVVGARWDLDVTEPLDFSRADWFDKLRDEVRRRGAMHEPTGSDYFLFRRGDAVGQLLPFAVGRPGWDNWMIYHALQLGVPVIDATPSWQVVHQNHDYSHVPNARGNSYEGPEADANRDLLTVDARRFILRHATHTLRTGVVRRRWDRELSFALSETRRVLAHYRSRVGRWMTTVANRGSGA